jgi:hypothetical protein
LCFKQLAEILVLTRDQKGVHNLPDEASFIWELVDFQMDDAFLVGLASISHSLLSLAGRDASEHLT